MRERPGLTALGLGAVLAAALALRVPLLGGGQIDYDEGVYWASLRSIASGHALFTSTYSSQPPAFLLLVLPAQLLPAQVGGGSIAAARFIVLLLSLAGIAAAGRVAWLLASPRAGLLAAALLAADPLFFRQSVALQADGPSVALAVAALAVAVEARTRRGPSAAALAAASGAVLAVAVLTKLLAVAAAPALVVALAAPPAAPRAGLRLLGATVVGGVAAAAAVLLPFAGAWPELWRQTVGLHLGARALALGGPDLPDVLRELPLAALGIAGCLVAVRLGPALAAAAACWAAAAALLLLVQHPLWMHHVVVLTAPLALAGGALADRLPARNAASAAAAGVLLAGSVASAVDVGRQEQPYAVVRPTVLALRSATAPGQLVISDDPYTVALAGRATPPALVDTSSVRVESGDLTTAEVESIALRPDVGAVLLATGRLSELPGLREWLQRQYGPATSLPSGRVLYLRASASQSSNAATTRR